MLLERNDFKILFLFLSRFGLNFLAQKIFKVNGAEGDLFSIDFEKTETYSEFVFLKTGMKFEQKNKGTFSPFIFFIKQFLEKQAGVFFEKKWGVLRPPLGCSVFSLPFCTHY